MTCIIGMKGKGGYVLVSDRRVVRGQQVFEEDKIITLRDEQGDIIVLAFAGLTGLRDKFIPQVSEGMYRSRARNLGEVIEGVENTIAGMLEKYEPRLEEKAAQRALVGGLRNLRNGRAELYILHPPGYAEEVNRFRGIGSAGSHAEALVRLFYEEGMELEDLLEIGCFVLLLIEGMRIDRNVGGRPDAVIIRDNEGIETFEEEEIEEEIKHLDKEKAFKTASEKMKESLEKLKGGKTGEEAKD